MRIELRKTLCICFDSFRTDIYFCSGPVALIGQVERNYVGEITALKVLSIHRQKKLVGAKDIIERSEISSLGSKYRSQKYFELPPVSQRRRDILKIKVDFSDLATFHISKVANPA